MHDYALYVYASCIRIQNIKCAHGVRGCFVLHFELHFEVNALFLKIRVSKWNGFQVETIMKMGAIYLSGRPTSLIDSQS